MLAKSKSLHWLTGPFLLNCKKKDTWEGRHLVKDRWIFASKFCIPKFCAQEKIANSWNVLSSASESKNHPNQQNHRTKYYVCNTQINGQLTLQPCMECVTIILCNAMYPDIKRTCLLLFSPLYLSRPLRVVFHFIFHAHNHGMPA